MPFNTNLAQEATTLTKWLISIPSVAHAKGPALISQAIYEGLSEFPYFKNHPEHLTLQAHENSAKSSVIALVKGLDDVQDTLVLLCHTDTNSPYHYGMLKGLSTNADELRKRLLEMSGSPLLNNKSNNSLIATDSSDSDLANPQASKQGSSMSAALNSAESAKASSATTGDSASTGASSAGASASSAYKTTGTTEAPESEESSPLSVGSNSILSGALKRALARDEAILGLGVLESKCATGSMLVALKELSDNSVRLNLNILFVCTSESSINHKGIKSCMPYLQELVQKEHLKLRLCLNAQPNLPQLPHDGDLHVYTGNYGKIEPSFYIIGNSSTSYRPYEGFSASIIAAELIRALELNPKITQKLQHKPLVPTFDSLRVKEFGKDFSPDGMQVSFNLPIGNVDLADLLETLKEVAATAIENAADLVEVREAAFAQMRHEEYTPTAKDAEVVSFSDLLERASHNFKGNLHKALQGMVQKCRSEGLSLHQASITIIERLNELARNTWRLEKITERLHESLLRVKTCLEHQAPILTLQNALNGINQEIAAKKEAGSTDRETLQQLYITAQTLEQYIHTLELEVPEQPFERLKELFASTLSDRETSANATGQALEHAFAFLDAALGNSQELVMFATELTAGFYTSWYIEQFGSDAYFKHNKDLLFNDTQEALLHEISMARKADTAPLA